VSQSRDKKLDLAGIQVLTAVLALTALATADRLTRDAQGAGRKCRPQRKRQ